MAVYFIQAGEGGPVKIGVTGNVTRRLALIQNAQAETCRLLHLFEGGRDEEQALHRHFAAHRLRGEWFRPATEIVQGGGCLPRAVAAVPSRPYTYRPCSEAAKVAAAKKRAECWADPEWAARRRAKYAADGPRLRELHHRRQVDRLANVAAGYRRSGQERNALAYLGMAHRSLEVLREITGLAPHELRPDVFPAPAEVAA